MKIKNNFLIFAGCLCFLPSISFANNDTTKDSIQDEENLLDGYESEENLLDGYESDTKSTSSEEPKTPVQSVSKLLSKEFPTQSYAAYRQKHSFKPPPQKHTLKDLNAMEKDLIQMNSKRSDRKKTLKIHDQNISVKQEVKPLKTIKDVLPKLTPEDLDALTEELTSMTKNRTNKEHKRHTMR